jgi:hypothetical protein
LARDFIAERRLIFFNIAEKKTPRLIDAVRNAGMESDLLKIPELKALAHVLDGFECSPWTQPEPEVRGVNYVRGL